MSIYRWVACGVLAFSTAWLYDTYIDNHEVPNSGDTNIAELTALAAGISHKSDSLGEAPSGGQKPKPVEKKQSSSGSYALKDNEKVLASFDSWLSTLSNSPSDEDIAKGVTLAEARKPYMQELIRTDPKLALQNAVTLKEYVRLPEAVAKQVEKPFSELTDLHVLPNESRRFVGLEQFNYLTSESGEQLTLYRYGQRRTILSKNSLPTQGISLAGESVISDQVLQRVSSSDAEFYISRFPSGNVDAEYDAYTGEAIAGKPVLAIAGGYLFSFSSTKNLNTLNQKLAEAEQIIGPDSGSQLLFAKSGAAMNGNATELESTESTLQNTLAVFLASPSTWTTTKKKVFFIRVDFPDITDPVIEKTVLENRINNDVSELIKDMSRDKTWLEADVSDLVVRMPEQSSEYVASSSTWTNANLLHDDAVAEFNSLSTGVDLSDYDIVGIYFNEIGFEFGGYASIGGEKQWLQSSYGVGLVTHEFGHNYGVSHANSWVTTNGSSVGSGYNQEYGDFYDLMGGGYSSDAHFHTQALDKLDWLDSDNWENITTSSNRRIYRFDHEDASGLQSLRVPRDSDDYYWLGYRKNFTRSENGIYVIWQRPSETQSWLVDTKPDQEGEVIAVGSTYSDTLTSPNIHITPLAKGGESPSEWIDVQVNIGSFTSNQPPSASISAPNSVAAREFVTFSAVASDPENDELAYAWDFGDGQVYNSQKTIHKYWIAGGTYTVKLTVSDMTGGVSETQTLDVTVTDPLIDFSSRVSGVSDKILDIATDGTKALAITSVAVLGSSDGRTWSKLDDREDGSTGFGYNTYLRSIIHNGTRWIAVGVDYNYETSSWEGAVYTSLDGIDWTERFWAGSSLLDIAGAGNILVAVGNDGFAIRSTDGGINWSPVVTGFSSYLTSISYGDNKFIVVGYDAVLTSTNGLTWVNETANTGVGVNGFSSINYANNKFFGGKNSSLAYLEQTSNMVFETAHTAYHSPIVAYGESLYLSVGSTYWFSVDGVNWLESSEVPAEIRTAVIFFKGTFITVGNSGTIYQSGIIEEIDSDGDGTPDSSDDDIDGDGMTNTWEELYGLNPFDPSDQYDDSDQDGLSNLEEFINSTDPSNPDTDGDRVNDGEEVAAGTNPNEAQAINIVPIILESLLLD